MSKLIKGDFSYPGTQEQGHNERNKSSNSHVLYPQCITRWQERRKFWLSTVQLLGDRGGGLTNDQYQVGFIRADWTCKRNKKTPRTWNVEEWGSAGEDPVG